MPGKAIVMFYCFASDEHPKTYQPARGKTNKKFKQNYYISCEPTQLMHFIQEK